MILRTSGIGVSIAFLREAQWGSRGREFDSRHSDQTKIIRTCFRWEMDSDYLFSNECWTLPFFGW